MANFMKTVRRPAPDGKEGEAPGLAAVSQLNEIISFWQRWSGQKNVLHF
jgi:hypothetical protein